MTFSDNNRLRLGRKRGLPTWFDIRKYEQTKSLDLPAWAWQIQFRSFLHWSLDATTGVEPDPDTVRISVSEIGEEPIVPHLANKLPLLDVSRSRDNLGPCDTPSVWLYDPELDGNRHFTICIDLRVSDAQIIGDLKRCLSRHRQIFGRASPKRRVSEADIWDWQKYRVLPFLDLTLWAKLEGERIPNRVLAKALFGNAGAYWVEQIRRTTKPMADRLISHDRPTVIALDALSVAANKKGSDFPSLQDSETRSN